LYKRSSASSKAILYKVLEDKGYQGETFEEMLESAKRKLMPSFEEITAAHEVRNAIVYNPDYKFDAESAKKIFSNYEKAIKNL
jgi:putative lipase involved disintegration of autophagic bodies